MGTEAHEVLIEFIATGPALKVIAIDPATGIEASIIGDPKQSRDSLARLAAQKLRYVLTKRDSSDPAPAQGGGIVV